MRKGLVKYDTDDAKQRTERATTGRQMQEMGLAGRVNNDGPDVPMKLTPRTLGEKARVKKDRLLAGGNPKKGGGVVGKTKRGY